MTALYFTIMVKQELYYIPNGLTLNKHQNFIKFPVMLAMGEGEKMIKKMLFKNFKRSG